MGSFWQGGQVCAGIRSIGWKLFEKKVDPWIVLPSSDCSVMPSRLPAKNSFPFEEGKAESHFNKQKTAELSK